MTATDLEVERNKAVVRELLAAADRGDLDAVAACFAGGYRDHTEGGTRTGSDKADALTAFAQFREAFPDTTHTIEHLIGEGDLVVLRVTAGGTHRQTFRGHPPTGRRVSLTQTATYRFRDGKIVERWVDGAESVLSRFVDDDGPGVKLADAGSRVRVLRTGAVPWIGDVPGAEYVESALSTVSLTWFRLEPGTVFAAHAHANEQITGVLEGELIVAVAAESHRLGPGDVIAIPSWVEHSVVAGDQPVLAVDAWSPPPEHLASA